jgi:hypothetical protein
VSKKGIIRIHPTDICTRNLRQKEEVSGFEKLMRSVPEIWGRMYDILPLRAKGMRNGTRNWIPGQAREGAKKLVSSDFAKILEY